MTHALPVSAVSASSDIELVGLVLAGDLRAFEVLMRRHNRILFRTARAILKDDAEAEDAVQEAYLHAYRSLGGFRGDAGLSTWLTRIAANEAFGRLRKRTRRAAIVPLHFGDETLPEREAALEAPAMDRPDSKAMRSEMRHLIEARIDELPDAYRVVFVCARSKNSRWRRPPPASMFPNPPCARGSSAHEVYCAKHWRLTSTMRPATRSALRESAATALSPMY